MEELDLSPDFLTQNAELLYQFVDMFSNYENTARDYGGNNYFTMNEIHVLSAIAKNPGIFSSTLAEQRRRSKGFISQIVTKLEKYGCVYKQSDAKDNKKKGLYPTERGLVLAKSHDDFDIQTLEKTYGYLRRDCTPEEIRHFYKVIKVYVNIMTAAKRKRHRLQLQPLQENTTK